MEPLWHQVDLCSENFTGGSGRQVFQAHERLLPLDGLKGGQSSSPKHVLTLGGPTSQGNSVQTTFELDEDLLPGKDQSTQVILRIRGMWDHMRNLGLEFGHLFKKMPTFGWFKATINDETVLDNRVYFWNYRQWRFWPCIEFPIEPKVLRPGLNRLTLMNQTEPFFQNIPKEYRTLGMDITPGAVSGEICDNVDYHLSDVQLLVRQLDDLEVLNGPDIVRCNEPFRIEIHATRPHDLNIVLPPNVECRSVPSLTPGRNTLWFKIIRPGIDVQIQGISRSTGKRFSFQCRQAVETSEQTPFLLGHILGGHLTTFVIPHHYRFWVDLFRDSGQGNLVVWLTEPRKNAEWITADQLPIDDILRNDLKVAFRYYGNFPPGNDYPDRLSRTIDDLGPSFVGLAPHEVGSTMSFAMKQTDTRSEAMDFFSKRVQSLLADLRSTAPKGRIWLTDPSLYANIYRRLGFDDVGLELFPLQCNLNIAATRGTAKTYGDRGWTAINSFECQAYGGLDMCEPMADLDVRYDEKRANLWWLSQFHLYLSGARMIYSESGSFHQVVTRHLDFNDPRCSLFRQAQKDLWEFAQFQSLTDQPRAGCAFVKSEYDLFSDTYTPTLEKTQPSDYTWERVRVVWPQLRWFNERLRALTVSINDRKDYSDTPFGEADIVTLTADDVVLDQYKVLILVGQHSVTREEADQLERYVRRGGQVVLSLADFDSRESLSHLTGCRRSLPTEANFLWEIEVADPAFATDFASIQWPCHLSRSLCDSTVMGALEPEDTSQVILRDRFTHRPFLIHRKLGQGTVWLLNVADYPVNREYQLVANRIVHKVLERTLSPVRLHRGQSVNHFLYTHPQNNATFHHLFVLNNDWYSPVDRHKADFIFDDISFPVITRRNTVSQAFLFPNLVIVPNSKWVRVDSYHDPAPGTRLVELQGRGKVAMSLYSPFKVNHIFLDEKEYPFYRNENRLRVHLPLKGKHLLKLSFYTM